MKTIIAIAVVVSMFGLTLYSLYFTSPRANKAYCLKLQSQSQEFDNFKVAVWESEMCEELNLPVEALINY